ncbi:MAG: hypothetical protein ACTSU5_02730 [Promethearchaeota archaeon]
MKKKKAIVSVIVIVIVLVGTYLVLWRGSEESRVVWTYDTGTSCYYSSVAMDGEGRVYIGSKSNRVVHSPANTASIV